MQGSREIFFNEATRVWNVDPSCEFVLVQDICNHFVPPDRGVPWSARCKRHRHSRFLRLYVTVVRHCTKCSGSSCTIERHPLQLFSLQKLFRGHGNNFEFNDFYCVRRTLVALRVPAWTSARVFRPGASPRDDE